MTERYYDYANYKREHEETIREVGEITLNKVEQTGFFSETIGINGMGFLIDHEKDGTPIASYMITLVSDFGKEGLYTIAKEIEAVFPSLRFSFENDPEGKWIRYEVKNTENKDL